MRNISKQSFFLENFIDQTIWRLFSESFGLVNSDYLTNKVVSRTVLLKRTNQNYSPPLYDISLLRSMQTSLLSGCSASRARLRSGSSSIDRSVVSVLTVRLFVVAIWICWWLRIALATSGEYRAIRWIWLNRAINSPAGESEGRGSDLRWSFKTLNAEQCFTFLVAAWLRRLFERVRAMVKNSSRVRRWQSERESAYKAVRSIC